MKDMFFVKRVLDNGLTVLLREDHSVPIVSHGAFYRVGSRNEVPGKTGISHFVEHMLFKGTRRFPGMDSVLEIFRNGGYQNAFTCWDYTAFIDTMSAEKARIAVEMEADRMANAVFDPEAAESERLVVLSEKEGNESSSYYRMTEALMKAAYPVHPYGRDITGETEDIRRITRDELYEHYRRRYVPNNAVVVSTGNFEPDEMLRLIEAAYGIIPAGTVSDESIGPEAPLSGPLTITGSEYTGIDNMQMVWRVPGARDPDIPAMILLTGILGGAGFVKSDGVEMSPNRTSRLYRRLAEKGACTGISGYYIPTRDPFVYRLSVSLGDGAEAEEVREKIFAEIEAISRNGVPDNEIEKVRKQAGALYAYITEDVSEQAFWLGSSSMFADPGWFTDYLQRLERVRAEDICRVAGSLFRRDQSITAISIKEEERL